MLVVLEGLGGEQRPFENKTFRIWLLNSKILPLQKCCLRFYYLNKPELTVCWGCVLQDQTVAGRRQHLTLGSVHSLPQNFC